VFHVRPSIPARLGALADLAYNLRWSWDHETIGLFRRLDRDLWETSGHNPVLMLGGVTQERMQEAEQDDAFLAHLDRVADRLREYMGAAGTWHRRKFGPSSTPLIAYFSMEFGLTECIQIYSGGLGVLAGDHLKSASELGIPLVGVGLLPEGLLTSLTWTAGSRAIPSTTSP
jgi:starch phosphorylase